MSGSLPPEAYAAALAGLTYLTPRRQLALLGRLAPQDAWESVRAGRVVVGGAPAREADIVEALRTQAGRVDPNRVWERCQELGVSVIVRGSAAYPDLLSTDPFGPAVLFACGAMTALAPPGVAIVGTRGATALGRSLAFEFGRDLSVAGVSVVSGLALGIDGAAHRGALAIGDASPIAVVGSGLDVVYPLRHADLWKQVGERGLLLSELPPGTNPQAHYFPARNRIIAALSTIVVVVESRERGGSLLTANEAIDRGRRVLAIPGSPRNPAAAGTNRLILDGALPVSSAAEVLGYLGIEQRALPFTVDPRAVPDDAGRRILDVLMTGAATLDDLIETLGGAVGEVALNLGRLEMAGWLVRNGGWFEIIHASEWPGAVR